MVFPNGIYLVPSFVFANFSDTESTNIRKFMELKYLNKTNYTVFRQATLYDAHHKDNSVYNTEYRDFPRGWQVKRTALSPLPLR